jgi:predicted nucleotidyltransferase
MHTGIYHAQHSNNRGTSKMAARNDLDAIIETARSYLRLLKSRNFAPITGAYLYGSYAKGTAHKDSDIDLAIVADEWKPDIIEAHMALARAACAIDTRIEPHPFRSDDFNAENPSARMILKTGIAIE